ncbi:MAG: hypothetical protein JXB13_06320, partial [Phycisphaerae bacterium]|nr:hypothetical protein [Phycisphaerae bacterium]
MKRQPVKAQLHYLNGYRWSSYPGYVADEVLDSVAKEFGVERDLLSRHGHCVGVAKKVAAE